MAERIPVGERLAKLEQRQDDMNRNMAINHNTIIDKLSKLDSKFDHLPEMFVTQKEYDAEVGVLKKLVYGAVGALLTAILSFAIWVIFYRPFQ